MGTLEKTICWQRFFFFVCFRFAAVKLYKLLGFFNVFIFFNKYVNWIYNDIYHFPARELCSFVLFIPFSCLFFFSLFDQSLNKKVVLLVVEISDSVLGFWFVCSQHFGWVCVFVCVCVWVCENEWLAFRYKLCSFSNTHLLTAIGLVFLWFFCFICSNNWLFLGSPP